MVFLKHQFQLIINLILDNLRTQLKSPLRSLPDLSLIFILDATIAISKKLLGLNLKIEELWNIYLGAASDSVPAAAGWISL